MSFDNFIGITIFCYLLCYVILIVFSGIRDVFPHEKKGIKIDFKQHD